MPNQTTIANKRLANRVIWNLEDIVAIVQEARREVDAAMKRAENAMDISMVRRLVEVDRRLTEIEHRARDARRGEYNADERDDSV